MDIEGFVRHALKQDDEITVLNSLKDKILEYKDIDPEQAFKMASAVIEEVKHTMEIEFHPDEFLRELIEYPKADVAMGQIGVGSRGAGEPPPPG
jgi:hydrogenase expression/formation protein